MDTTHHTAQNGLRMELRKHGRGKDVPDSLKGKTVLLGQGSMEQYADFVRNREDEAKLVPWSIESTTDGMGKKYSEKYRSGTFEGNAGWINGDWSPLPAPDPKALDELCATGWAEGVSKVSDLAQDLRKTVPEVVDVHDTYEWQDEFGDELDILRLYAGEMDKMWYRDTSDYRPSTRVVRLMVPVGGNSNLSGDQLFWSGAAATVLTDLLQEAGYRVELQSYFISDHSGSGTNDAVTVTVTDIKSAEDYVSLADIAMSCSLPAFFRGIAFRWYTVAPFYIGWGWGSDASKRLKEMLPALGLVEHGETLVVDQARNREEAIKVIASALEQVETALAGASHTR